MLTLASNSWNSFSLFQAEYKQHLCVTSRVHVQFSSSLPASPPLGLPLWPHKGRPHGFGTSCYTIAMRLLALSYTLSHQAVITPSPTTLCKPPICHHTPSSISGFLANHLGLEKSCQLPHTLCLLEAGRKLWGGPCLMTCNPYLMIAHELQGSLLLSNTVL